MNLSEIPLSEYYYQDANMQQSSPAARKRELIPNKFVGLFDIKLPPSEYYYANEQQSILSRKRRDANQQKDGKLNTKSLGNQFLCMLIVQF
jgi:hypothetical protein